MSYENEKIDGSDRSFKSNNHGPSWDRLCTTYEKMWRQPLSASVALGKNSPDVQDIFVGVSSSLKEICGQIQKIAPTKKTVLVTGESGVGKNVLVKNIHNRSKRNGKPFVEINCGGLPESSLQSELFGHAQWAFTDAKNKREGLFKTARGGTIFLNEIGEMYLPIQTSLLRVLDDGFIKPLGSDKSSFVDVRVIAATNADLTELVKQKKFREDLYYRLKRFEIILPPLRKRRDDIIPLARFFVTCSALEQNKEQEIEGISPECEKVLQCHDWLGNIRVLKDMMDNAVIFSSGPLISSSDVFKDGELPPHTISSADSRELAIIKNVYASPTAINHTNLTMELLKRLGQEGESLTPKKLAATLGIVRRHGQRLYNKIIDCLGPHPEIPPSSN